MYQIRGHPQFGNQFTQEGEGEHCLLQSSVGRKNIRIFPKTFGPGLFGAPSSD